jgi:O-antigen/teichoic acid export membrane protein
VEVAAAVAVTLFASGLPLGLSSRLLLGAERNDVAIAFQGSASIAALLIIVAAAAAHAPLWVYVAAPSAGAALAAAAAWPMASSASGLSWSKTLRSASVLSHPGARIAHLAGPMLVITAAVPIAFQSDRLLLSHLSTLDQVAVYGVAAQLYSTLIGLAWASGISLWPMFARRRAYKPVSRRELIKLSLVFWLGGIILAVALVAAGPWVAQFVSKGKIEVGYGVFAAFGLLLVVHASWWPISMLLTDRDGLRFQATAYVAMMVLNVPASAALAQRIGAAGPVLGSVAASIVALWIPGVWRALAVASRQPLVPTGAEQPVEPTSAST